MPLPETQQGHEAMLACVGRLTKTARFIPAEQAVDAPTVAKLHHEQVFMSNSSITTGFPTRSSATVIRGSRQSSGKP